MWLEISWKDISDCKHTSDTNLESRPKPMQILAERRVPTDSIGAPGGLVGVVLLEVVVVPLVPVTGRRLRRLGDVGWEGRNS